MERLFCPPLGPAPGEEPDSPGERRGEEQVGESGPGPED